MLQNIFRASFVGFLLFPFLFLIWQFRLGMDPDWAEIWWAGQNSFWQAFGSATLSILLGLWGAGGLICFSDGKRPWRSALEMLLLIPNFLPAIFSLIAMFNLVDPFPMGLAGMILVHATINWGLAAVILAGLIEQRAGGVAELAWIEGSSRWRFYFRGLLPMLWKEIGLLWLFIFAVCFGSFAVPLAVGGGRGTTLEVLIYEKIRLSTDWGQAVAIAVMQSCFLFLLAWLTAAGRGAPRARAAKLKLCEIRSGVFLILFTAVAFVFGFLQGFPSGWEQMSSLQEMNGDLLRALLGSLSIGLSTGILCLGLLLLMAVLIPSGWFEKFMTGYTAPSAALASFAALLVFPNEGYWPFLKIPIVLSLLTLPALWRMGWHGEMEGLKRQKETAQTLGASGFLIWRHILLPQMMGRATTLAGLAAVWACGDFAISRILAHRDITIAMMTETLMSSYRLGLATLMSAGVFAVAVFCFLIVKGAGRVFGRTTLS